ncbi:MAG: bifunctional diguanylate cyclase/phosphodiesterase, partial [Janthinobacterium lividum]
MRDARRSTGNVAGAAEQVITRTIEAIDQRLLLTRDAFRQDPTTFALAFAPHAVSLGGGPTFQLAAIRPDGQLWLSSIGPVTEPIDLSDRQHFRVHRDSQRDELFVSTPVQGRESGRWSVQLTRKLLRPDGSFAGVLVASLDPYWLTEIYETLDFGRGAITLVGTDGVIRARAPLAKNALGHRVDLDGELAALLAASHGSQIIRSPVDGRMRVISSRRLTGLPLVVLVGQDMKDVLASYHDYQTRGLLVGSGLTTLVVLVGALLIRQQRRQIASRQALSNAVENIDQGLMLVDATGRVAVLNQQMVALFALPSHLAVPGIRVSQILGWQLHGDAGVSPDREAQLGGSPWLAAHALLPEGIPPEADGHVTSDSAADVPRAGRIWAGRPAPGWVWPHRIARPPPVIAPPMSEPLARVHEHMLPSGRMLQARIKPLPDGGRVCTYADVTRQRQADQRIHHLAKHDVLTDLPNRFALQEQLSRTLEEAGQRGSQVALLYLDLDRFKPVNDLLGHAVGDALLVQVARRLQAELHPGDMLARVGGDEFVLLAVSAECSADAAALAVQIIGMLEHPFELEGRQVELGVSVGIALYPTDGATESALLHAADTALYRAKEEQRGSFRVFEPEMDERLQERRQLEQDLRHAVDRGELVLHYQPILCCRSGAIAGFEALVRWQHPARGLLLPGAFIPLAEESGMIARIGEWVIGEACATATTWPAPLWVAVNVSPVQFQRSDLSQIVADALALCRLAPDRLEVEVTESVLIGDNRRALEVMEALRA